MVFNKNFPIFGSIVRMIDISISDVKDVVVLDIAVQLFELLKSRRVLACLLGHSIMKNITR